ncbi:MAG: hypothetical protein ACOZNI_30215 [Myxococcota bacterium]
MTPLHLDVTAAYSILSAALVLLGAAWVLWGSAWLRRVELASIAAPAVRDLGLRFAREGWGARVVASGAIEGRAVEVRWREKLDGAVIVEARVGGGAWTPVPAGETASAVRALSG